MPQINLFVRPDLSHKERQSLQFSKEKTGYVRKRKYYEIHDVFFFFFNDNNLTNLKNRVVKVSQSERNSLEEFKVFETFCFYSSKNSKA